MFPWSPYHSLVAPEGPGPSLKIPAVRRGDQESRRSVPGRVLRWLTPAGRRRSDALIMAGGGAHFNARLMRAASLPSAALQNVKKPQPAQNKSSIQHVEPLPLHTHTQAIGHAWACRHERPESEPFFSTSSASPRRHAWTPSVSTSTHICMKFSCRLSSRVHIVSDSVWTSHSPAETFDFRSFHHTHDPPVRLPDHRALLRSQPTVNQTDSRHSFILMPFQTRHFLIWIQEQNFWRIFKQVFSIQWLTKNSTVDVVQYKSCAEFQVFSSFVWGTE